MTDSSGYREQSLPGMYFIDGTCICCGVCTTYAPALFAVNLEKEIGYVQRQPQDKKEEIAVRKALANCPVSAIREYEENKPNSIQGGLV